MTSDTFGELGSYAALALFAVCCLTLVGRWIARKSGLFQRRNFRGESVPIIGGAVLLLTAPLLLSTDPVTDTHFTVSWSMRFAIAAFALLGLIDDWRGDRSTGGFRGHFRALFKEGRVTTGVVKALAGGLLAIWIAYLLDPAKPFHIQDHAYPRMIAQGLLIALAANTANLFDLRPGRCAVVTIYAATIFTALWCFMAREPVAVLNYSRFDIEEAVGVLVGCALGLYLFDRSAKIMLGDAGSNALGAAVGVLYAAILPLWGIVVGIVLLAAFQIWCEKHSLSAFIESKPLLKRIDRMIGVR